MNICNPLFPSAPKMASPKALLDIHAGIVSGMFDVSARTLAISFEAGRDTMSALRRIAEASPEARLDVAKTVSAELVTQGTAQAASVAEAVRGAQSAFADRLAKAAA